MVSVWDSQSQNPWMTTQVLPFSRYITRWLKTSVPLFSHVGKKGSNTLHSIVGRIKWIGTYKALRTVDDIVSSFKYLQYSLCNLILTVFLMAVWIIYCCITDCHNFTALNNTYFCLTISVGQGYGHCLIRFSISFSHKATMKVLTRAWVHLWRVTVRFASKLIWLLARFISLWSEGLRASVSRWLLVRGHPKFLGTWACQHSNLLHASKVESQLERGYNPHNLNTKVITHLCHVFLVRSKSFKPPYTQRGWLPGHRDHSRPLYSLLTTMS